MALLPLLLLALLPVLSATVPDQFFSDCAPTPVTCGNLTINVSYPFHVNTRPPYCSHPWYELFCVSSGDTSKLIIYIKDVSYQVLAIDYHNSLLTIVDYAVAGQSCPRPFSNTTMDFSLFDYTELDRNLTLYVNCSGSALSIPTLADVACLAGLFGKHSYYRLDNGTAGDVILGSCNSTVLVPMNHTMADQLVDGGGGDVGFEDAVKAGFTVRWLAGLAWCGGCMSSGGRCGYNFGVSEQETCYCENGLAVKACSKGGDKKRKILIGVLAGMGGFLLACVLCFLWFWRKRQQRSSSSNAFMEPSSYSELDNRRDPILGSPTYPTHFFPYQELQEATDFFNASKEVGDGGFGRVYKGELRDGRTVAVKRLYDNNYKRVEQFVNEVKILSGLRHQNLVTLYGCTSPHSRELLLVYEYVPNATVADHLHGSRAHEGNLLWRIRLSIAVETANALAYLHAVEPPVIHRDVKTNNILLDKSFHVKVADFGLSRLFPIDATHISTAPQGTPGYLDPEYHQCYQLTTKSDVYSFGVVLVELLSSKPAVDLSRERDEINLANMAIQKIQRSELDELVDPQLGYGSDPDVKAMITQVAELAFRCLQGDREMRPAIKEVQEVLRGIEAGFQEKTLKETDGKKQNGVQSINTVKPSSPDSVVDKWASKSTTPNASGYCCLYLM